MILTTIKLTSKNIKKYKHLTPQMYDLFRSMTDKELEYEKASGLVSLGYKRYKSNAGKHKEMAELMRDEYEYAYLLVDVSTDMVIGMIWVYNYDGAFRNTHCIGALSVRAEHRGCGYGTYLVKTVLANYKRKSQVTLSCYTLNKRALNFYKKLGFKPYLTDLVLT